MARTRRLLDVAVQHAVGMLADGAEEVPQELLRVAEEDSVGSPPGSTSLPRRAPGTAGLAPGAARGGQRPSTGSDVGAVPQPPQDQDLLPPVASAASAAVLRPS